MNPASLHEKGIYAEKKTCVFSLVALHKQALKVQISKNIDTLSSIGQWPYSYST